MPHRLAIGLALLLGAGALFTLPAAARSIVVDATLMKSLDPDHDGTVDLAEAENAGIKMFKKLDTDHDGTLDLKELAGRVTEKEFKEANPDNDGTLDEAEFKALIGKLFKEANPDDDGTLDEAELKAAKGQKLLEIIA